jgi:hypothetical protein
MNGLGSALSESDFLLDIDNARVGSTQVPARHEQAVQEIERRWSAANTARGKIA